MNEFIKNTYTKGYIKIYLIVKDGNQWKLKSLDAHEDVTKKIRNLLEEPISSFINKLDDLKDIKDAYDNTNSIYKLDASTFNPFDFFKETEEKFGKNDIPDGFAIVVGFDTKKMWIYQNIYQTAIIKSKNKVSITYDNNSYCVLNHDLISFEKRIDAIKIDDTYLISNYKIIEKKFNYKELINNISNEVIKLIKDLNIVENVEKIQQCAGVDKITFAKKLMKAKDSPVFKVEKNQLIENAKKSASYSKLIKNNEFIIDNITKANIFVKMLNDQLLRSELTGEVYDAQVKKKFNENDND